MNITPKTLIDSLSDAQLEHLAKHFFVINEPWYQKGDLYKSITRKDDDFLSNTWNGLIRGWAQELTMHELLDYTNLDRPIVYCTGKEYKDQNLLRYAIWGEYPDSKEDLIGSSYEGQDLEEVYSILKGKI